MKKFAKLINETSIEFPPKNKGNIINYNLNEEFLIQDGYKEFVPAEKEVNKSYKRIIEIATEIPQPTPDEQLAQAKEAKKQEASNKATEYIQSGEALYEYTLGKHIEATDGNIGKFAAYAVAYIKGQLAPLDTVIWNTKEDETVELTQEQVSDILNGLGLVQANVWTVKYPAYLQQIEQASTIEELEAIEIDYNKEIN